MARREHFKKGMFAADVSDIPDHSACQSRVVLYSNVDSWRFQEVIVVD